MTRRLRVRAWILAAAIAVWGALTAAPALTADPPAAAGREEGPVPRVGRAIRLGLPITGQSLAQVRRFVRRSIEQATQEKARLVLILQFEVAPQQADFGRSTEFGDAYNLADFLSSEELNAVTTVAYLPKTLQGHAVLVALACDEIIMAPEAEIGPAGADDGRTDPVKLAAYRQIANRPRTVPAEIAQKMLDPQRKVLEVETESSRRFIAPDELEQLRKGHTIQSVRELAPAGRPGVFSAAEARRLGFVNYLARDRRDVARALELPPEAVEEDPSLGEGWRAVRVDLKGPIRRDLVDQAQRLIGEKVRTGGVNFVCLWIDSPGGSPEDSIRLANYLALDLAGVRTVAYIPREARSDAALVALACDQIVMHPGAVLGGWGAGEFSQEQVRLTTQTLREELAPRKGRSWSLPAAMIDAKLDVLRCRSRLGDEEFFCDEELSEQLAPDTWEKGPRVTTPGEPFQAFGRQAAEYRLANRTVESFADFKRHYCLEGDPALLEPDWADQLIEALASPAVASLLLTIGFLALYVEVQSPGVGVGAFLAAVCFVLFFWSRYLGGTAGWLEVMLFLVGIACLALEVFVIPGFGIFGLGGGALVLASIILASQTFVIPHNAYQFAQMQRSLWMLLGAAAAIIVLAILLRRWLPRAPGLGRMLLAPPSSEEAESIRRRDSLIALGGLVGARGTTTTPLVPCGKARFGSRLLDVTAETDLIPRGTLVVVVEVHGNRIVVQPVKGKDAQV